MSPPTRSSMTRSTMLRTNVTPAAMRTCRSTGESSAGRSSARGPSAPRRRSASPPSPSARRPGLGVVLARGEQRAQTSAAGSGRSTRSAIVGPSAVTSARRSPATATRRGPRPGAHSRPTSTARSGVAAAPARQRRGRRRVRGSCCSVSGCHAGWAGASCGANWPLMLARQSYDDLHERSIRRRTLTGSRAAARAAPALAGRQIEEHMLDGELPRRRPAADRDGAVGALRREPAGRARGGAAARGPRPREHPSRPRDDRRRARTSRRSSALPQRAAPRPGELRRT